VDAGGRVSVDVREADGRSPSLDGLRGLAVAGVLLFHGGVGWLPGGFLGVDAFFVLSGYLITTLLVREWRGSGRIALGEFWARRARRLLPALVLVVVAVCLVGRVLLSPDELTLLRGDVLATAAYVANWRMIWRGADYFSQTATPSWLQHTWSLGIEEQFYLLWPLVLVAVLRLRRGRGNPVNAALLVAVVGVVASAGAGLVLTGLHADTNRLYFGSDTRALAVLTGCALALAAARWPRPSARGRVLLGLAATVGAVSAGWLWTHADGTDGWLYPAGLLVDALAVAAVLAHAVLVPGSLTGRVLALPGLPALGRISYGVYLWHWPLFAWLDGERVGLTGPALFVVRCLATLAVAGTSFVLVERPIQRGVRIRRRRVAPVLAGAGALLAVVAAGAVALLPTTASEDGIPLASESGDVVASPVVPGTPAPTTGTGTTAATGTAHHHVPGTPESVVVMGDSIAWTLVRYLPAVPGVVVHDDTMLGCGVALGGPYRYFGAVQNVPAGCAAWPTMLRDKVDADDPDVVVILVGRWETMDRVYQGRWTHLGDPAFDDYLRGQLTRAVSIASARGAKVVLMTEPYNRRGERPDGGLWPEDQPDRVDRWNALVRQVAATEARTVRIADFGRLLCPQGTFTWDVDGIRVRSDGVHLTPDGVRWLVPWLKRQLAVG
jgi:peptidoglycan/LPS O-acetylase OafA/YrhL